MGRDGNGEPKKRWPARERARARHARGRERARIVARARARWTRGQLPTRKST